MPGVWQVLRHAARGVRPRPDAPSPGGDPGEAIAGSHPRLLLTAAELATLRGWKDTPTAEYTALKSYVDANAITPTEAALNASLGTGGAGTTFTVASVPGGWPTASHQVIIGLETLTATRSGTTFTVVSRGNNPGLGNTPTQSHAAGDVVWYKPSAGDFNGLAQSCALLEQLGVAGYGDKARYYLAELCSWCSPATAYQDNNAIRWYFYHLALAYDWAWHLLGSAERAYYTDLMDATCAHHVTNAYEGNPPFANRQSLHEQFALNNHVSGQVRSVLAMAAAMYDEKPTEAATYFAAEVAKVQDWTLPALNGGAGTDALQAEGSEYSHEDWEQIPDYFFVLDSATGSDGAWVALIEDYLGRLVKSFIYLTLPGTTSSTTTTTLTMSSGATTGTVASAADFAVGQNVTVGGGVWDTAIVGIAGTTFTFRDPAPQAFSGAQLAHRQSIQSWGDVENFPNFNDYPITGGQMQCAVARAARTCRGISGGGCSGPTTRPSPRPTTRRSTRRTSPTRTTTPSASSWAGVRGPTRRPRRSCSSPARSGLNTSPRPSGAATATAARACG